MGRRKGRRRRCRREHRRTEGFRLIIRPEPVRILRDPPGFFETRPVGRPSIRRSDQHLDPFARSRKAAKHPERAATSLFIDGIDLLVGK